MKTIGIIGSRRRDAEVDFWAVHEMFQKLYCPGDGICSGLCPKGGDWFAVLIALGMDYVSDERERKGILKKVKEGAIEYKIQPIWFPPEWDKYGKAAGFIRNADIAKKSDILIACVTDDRTGGTEDTISRFIKAKSGGLYLVHLV